MAASILIPLTIESASKATYYLCIQGTPSVSVGIAPMMSGDSTLRPIVQLCTPDNGLSSVEIGSRDDGDQQQRYFYLPQMVKYGGGVVISIVVDMDAADPSDYLKVYVNGTPCSNHVDNISSNNAIDLLGNGSSGSLSIEPVALSSFEVKGIACFSVAHSEPVRRQWESHLIERLELQSPCF